MYSTVHWCTQDYNIEFIIIDCFGGADEGADDNDNMLDVFSLCRYI